MQALQDGNKKIDFTDKLNIDKYLRVDIKQPVKDSFEFSQPFLIKCVLALLGLDQGTMNTKLTPVGEPHSQQISEQ